MSDQISARAVVCTAHLMLLQNPEAYVDDTDWVTYLCLVRDWCAEQEIDGVRYYFHPADVEDDSERTLQ